MSDFNSLYLLIEPLISALNVSILNSTKTLRIGRETPFLLSYFFHWILSTVILSLVVNYRVKSTDLIVGWLVLVFFTFQLAGFLPSPSLVKLSLMEDVWSHFFICKRCIVLGLWKSFINFYSPQICQLNLLFVSYSVVTCYCYRNCRVFPVDNKLQSSILLPKDRWRR